MERIHAAIGKVRNGAVLSSSADGRDASNKAGIVMSHHLHCYSPPTGGLPQSPQLRLLVGYESGIVVHYARSGKDAEVRERTVEGRGWDTLWSCKLHVESGTTHPPLLGFFESGLIQHVQSWV